MSCGSGSFATSRAVRSASVSDHQGWWCRQGFVPPALPGLKAEGFRRRCLTHVTRESREGTGVRQGGPRFLKSVRSGSRPSRWRVADPLNMGAEPLRSGLSSDIARKRPTWKEPGAKMSRDRRIPCLDAWHKPSLRLGRSSLPRSAGVRDPLRFLRFGWGRMSPGLS